MNRAHIADRQPIMETVESGKTYYWCQCGLSRQQPFCDGSHRDTPFTPLAWTAEKSGTIAFCACKQTHTPPFCDGSHRNLD